MRRWWASHDRKDQVAILGVAVALLGVLATLGIGVATAIPAYLALPPSGGSSPPPASPVLPTPTPTGPATPTGSTGPTPAPTPTASTGPGPGPEPPEPLPTTKKPSPSPTPVRFSFSIPSSVPVCSDLAGRGETPRSGKVVLFVQFSNEAKYYYERPLTFDASSRTWRVSRVVIGGDQDSGKLFHLYAVPVSSGAAAELATHDGAPYFVTTLPGPTLGRAAVTRTDQVGNC